MPSDAPAEAADVPGAHGAHPTAVRGRRPSQAVHGHQSAWLPGSGPAAHRRDGRAGQAAAQSAGRGPTAATCTRRPAWPCAGRTRSWRVTAAAKAAAKATGTAAKAGMGLHVRGRDETGAAPSTDRSCSDRLSFCLQSIHGYFTAVGFTDRPVRVRGKPYQRRPVVRHGAGVGAPADARQPDGQPLRRGRRAGQPAGARVLHGRGGAQGGRAAQRGHPPRRRRRRRRASPPCWRRAGLTTGRRRRRPTWTHPGRAWAATSSAPSAGAHQEGRHAPLQRRPPRARPRRELLLYRLQAPLPAADANAHVLVHAYEATATACSWPATTSASAASPSSPASATASSCTATPTTPSCTTAPTSGWIHEWSMPRSAAGRVMIVCKIWSPAGLHVATAYQDGLARAQKGYGPEPRI